MRTGTPDRSGGAKDDRNAISNRRVRAFFDYAAELAAEDRPRFLECLERDDPALRAAIDRLLAFDRGDDGFLASPFRGREWDCRHLRSALDDLRRDLTAVDPATVNDSESANGCLADSAEQA